MPIEAEASVAVATPGLRANILSPLETLSQSISAIAPTTTPAMTIPLVFALAGNGAWLAYLIAAAAVFLLALCIARFARTSASPGSLYRYATDSLPPIAGRTAGWALLLAYIATGSSVVGGFLNYAEVLFPNFAGHLVPTPLFAVATVSAATAIAYRDVQASARLMLLIEATSAAAIAVVVALVLIHTGLHLDLTQLRLTGITGSGMRLGTVLALFSFVGFESATTLGHEAKHPLRTIPRAVVQSAILSGLFFLTAAYTEALGFHQLHQDLGTSDAPMRALATLAGVPILGPLIDIGALISMFACTLACIIAAARVLLRMAQDGLAPKRFGVCHAANATPCMAVVATGASILAPAAWLAARGTSGADIYAWMGALAVYGFLTVYALVALALPFYLRRCASLTPAALVLSLAATFTMLLFLAGNLYPVPPRPYNWIPYAYLVYLVAGMAWFQLRRKGVE